MPRTEMMYLKGSEGFSEAMPFLANLIMGRSSGYNVIGYYYPKYPDIII